MKTVQTKGEKDKDRNFATPLYQVNTGIKAIINNVVVLEEQKAGEGVLAKVVGCHHTGGY